MNHSNHPIIRVYGVKNLVVQYFKTSDNQKKGVFVSGESHHDPNLIKIGYSLCNTSAGDIFDKERGFDIALKRLYLGKNPYRKLPDSMVDDFVKFLDRISFYYKRDDQEFFEYPNVKEEK